MKIFKIALMALLAMNMTTGNAVLAEGKNTIVSEKLIEPTATAAFKFDVDPYVQVTKKCALTGELLQGAVFQIQTKDGTVVATLDPTDSNGVTRTYGFDGPFMDNDDNWIEYVLVEVTAPEHHTLAQPITFTFEGMINDANQIKHRPIEVKDGAMVGVSKINVAGEEVSGPTICIGKLTANEGCDHSVTTYQTDEQVNWLDLKEGTYVIHEENAEQYGYEPIKKRTFTVDAEGRVIGNPVSGETQDDLLSEFVYDEEQHTLTLIDGDLKKTKIEISKMNIAGDEIAGAKFELSDKNGVVVALWESEEAVSKELDLPLGEYTLVEREAPEGYICGEKIKFKVTEDGIEITDGKTILTESFGDRLEILNKETVKIRKVNELLNPLADAVLGLFDEDDKVVHQWTTTNDEWIDLVLEPGKYTLRELDAPKGYEVFVDVEFEVDDFGVVTLVDDTQEDVTLEEHNLIIVKDMPMPEAIVVPLTLSKKFADDTERALDMTFTFNVEPDALSPKPDKNEYQITVPAGTSTSEVTTTTTIQFEDPGTYTYTITENTSVSLPGVSYALAQDGAKSSYTMEVTVTKDRGRLNASVKFNDQTFVNPTFNQLKALFVNKYKYENTQFSIPVKKVVTGEPRITTKDFTFSLRALDPANPMPATRTVTINDNGEASFAPITFTKAGSYSYAVTEVIPADRTAYTYDENEYIVEVNVKDVNGKLTTTWSLNGRTQTDSDHVTFTNAYRPVQTSVSIPVKKVITGSARPSEKTFTFTLNDGTTDRTVTIDGEGEASFAPITFTKAGTYSYTVSEVSGGEPGYQYSADVKNIQIEVVDDGGYLKLTQASRDSIAVDKMTFTNTYAPGLVSTELDVAKKLKADSPDHYSQTFNFIITPEKNAYPMFDNPNVMLRFGDGDFRETHQDSFGKVEFTSAGTYTYLIQEVNQGARGYVYAPDQVLTVEVEDQNGQLVIKSQKIAGEETDIAVFTNDYKPKETSLKIQLAKFFSLDSHERFIDATFTFNVYDKATHQLVTTGTVDTTAGTSQDNYYGETGEIKFTNPGVYEYTIEEQVNSALSGFTYAASKDITVEIKDDRGELYVASQTGTVQAEFVNAYAAAPTAFAIPVTKAFTRDSQARPTDVDFRFELSGGNLSAPKTLTITMPSGTDEVTKTFDALAFDVAGTYTYTIKELDDHKPGYSYDTTARTMEIKVIDDNAQLRVGEVKLDGTPLDLTGTLKDKGPVIVNRYGSTATSVTLNVEKKFSDDTVRPSEKVFEFELYDGANRLETIRINGIGNAQFKPLVFNSIGTYTYTIREVNGNEPGYTYDSTDHTVVITVTDQNGQLVSSVEIDGNQDVMILPITNTYQPKRVEFFLPVEKIVQGTNAKDTFTFTLKAKGNSPLPQENSVSVNGAGTVLFGPMTFMKVGTYTYELSEAKGTQNYTYDETVHEIVVNVTDNNGTLEAYFTDNGKAVDKVTFTNVYRKKSPVVNTSDTIHIAMYFGIFLIAEIAGFMALRTLKKQNRIG